jgi:hypothetical protein
MGASRDIGPWIKCPWIVVMATNTTTASFASTTITVAAAMTRVVVRAGWGGQTRFGDAETDATASGSVFTTSQWENTIAAGPKSCGRGVRGIGLLPCFLKDKCGTHLRKRGERHIIWEKRAKLAKLVVEATDDGEDEGFVGDFLADVAERVGKRLELGAVVMDGHVSLGHLVELNIEGFSCFHGRGWTWGPKSVTP